MLWRVLRRLFVQLEGKLENTEVSTKYEITRSLICSPEHVEHELSILKDVGEVQRRD